MAQATTDDTDQTRLAHIKCMLAHLEKQEREAAPDGAPTDIMTELSTLADMYLTVSRLDRKAQQRVMRWLDERLDDDDDTSLPRF